MTYGADNYRTAQDLHAQGRTIEAIAEGVLALLALQAADTFGFLDNETYTAAEQAWTGALARPTPTIQYEQETTP